MKHDTKNPWIENWLPRPNAQVRLFCFPHVGGSAAIYRTWPAKFSEQVELLTVELPGRGQRFGETPFSSLKEMLIIFHQAISSYLDKPFFIFGHSMGALIAYEWALLLQKEKQTLPLKLFLSAFGAPHVALSREKQLHLLSDKEFLEELHRLKGTPAEVLKHKELMQLLIPMIRADLKMVETYQYQVSEALALPLCVLGGTQDSEVEESKLLAWKDLTSSVFKSKFLEGDHFFIQSKRDELVHFISQEIESVCL